MERENKFRYDPLYRVIDVPSEVNIVEGSFRNLFDKLKNINNLGIIPTVLEMAKYSKYEHHFGVIHQINSLLECDKNKKLIPEKKRICLKLSAIFLHVGHVPFTYSTERALLIAANIDGNIQKSVDKKVKKVLEHSGIEDKEQNKYYDSLFLLKEYGILYKYFSAYEIIKRWDKIKVKFNLGDSEKKIIIRNMIDENSYGYKLLMLSNKVDFVQRDALYFGTARIDISPKHLYTKENLLKSIPEYSVNEIELIENNYRYLKGRFYENSKVRSFSRLYEKIVASLIMSKKFDLSLLESLDDIQFKRLITENNLPTKKSIGLPNFWIDKAKKLFEQKIIFSSVFEIKYICFNEQSIIKLEYKLLQLKRSKRGLLKYPFDKGILLDINYSEEEKYLIYPGYKSFSISIFQEAFINNDNPKRIFTEILRVINQLSHHCSIKHVDKIKMGLCQRFSWTNLARINNIPLIEVISKAIQNIEKKEQNKKKFLDRFSKALMKIKLFKELWHNFDNYSRFSAYKFLDSAGKEKEFLIYKTFVTEILNLPVKLFQFKSTEYFITHIYEELINMISIEENRSMKGNIFETLWYLNRLIDSNARFRLLINGVVVEDINKPKAKMDKNEFDVIDLFINKHGKAECCIYACSISSDYEKNNKEQLYKLAKHIHDHYPLLKIKTKYVVPENVKKNNWDPKDVEAGCAYNVD